MNDRRVRWVLLAAIVLLAFGIRVAGLKGGLPSETRRLCTYHPDESVTFYSLERMDPAKFDFFPGEAFSWGSFQIYLQAAVSEAMVLSGAVTLGGREFLLSHLGEVDKLYIAGRLTVMIFGAAAAVLIYCVAGLVLETGFAMLAAFFFGFLYVAVFNSLFVKPDSLLVFWGLLSVYFAFKVVKEPSARNYLLSGAFLGLSAASKYNGGVFAFFIVWSHFCVAWREKRVLFNFRLLLLAGFAAIGVFVLVNPYSVIRFPALVEQISSWANRGAVSDSALTQYFKLCVFTLPLSMGWPLFLMSLAGLPLLVRDRTPQSLGLVAFIFLYTLKFGAMTSPLLSYFLPVTILLVIAAARFASAVSGRRLGLIAVALVTAYTAAYTVYLKSLLWKPGSPLAASVWIEENIPAGAAIAIPKNDVWTPPVLRQYASPYRVIEAASSQAKIAYAFTHVATAAARADYVVLAQTEYDAGVSLLSPEERRRTINAILDDFSEIKRFETPLNRFFVPTLNGPHTFELKMKTPDIRIYKRKGSARASRATAPEGRPAPRLTTGLPSL